MNKTITIVGGLVVVAAIAGVAFYATQNKGPVVYDNTATSTPVVPPADTGTPAPNPLPDQVQQPGIPAATTDPAAVPTDTTVVVTGTVVPDGAFTNYWYEYGTTSALGNKIANQVVGSGYPGISAPGYITGLSKDTTYYFRLVAENQYGRVAGAEYSFQTTHGNPPPVGTVPTVQTLPASGIAATSATLNGAVTPNRAATQYWFEYGKDQNLGGAIGFVSVGAGTAKVPASISLPNINPGTTYYFRLDAQNEFGTVVGSIVSFKTSGPSPKTK